VFARAAMAALVVLLIGFPALRAYSEFPLLVRSVRAGNHEKAIPTVMPFLECLVGEASLYIERSHPEEGWSIEVDIGRSLHVQEITVGLLEGANGRNWINCLSFSVRPERVACGIRRQYYIIPNAGMWKAHGFNYLIGNHVQGRLLTKILVSDFEMNAFAQFERKLLQPDPLGGQPSASIGHNSLDVIVVRACCGAASVAKLNIQEDIRGSGSQAGQNQRDDGNLLARGAFAILSILLLGAGVKLVSDGVDASGEPRWRVAFSG
jgi:hypothetical protein